LELWIFRENKYLAAIGRFGKAAPQSQISDQNFGFDHAEIRVQQGFCETDTRKNPVVK
jgi:hypothetical protein